MCKNVMKVTRQATNTDKKEQECGQTLVLTIASHLGKNKAMLRYDHTFADDQTMSAQ